MAMKWNEMLSDANDTYHTNGNTIGETPIQTNDIIANSDVRIGSLTDNAIGFNGPLFDELRSLAITLPSLLDNHSLANISDPNSVPTSYICSDTSELPDIYTELDEDECRIVDEEMLSLTNTDVESMSISASNETQALNQEPYESTRCVDRLLNDCALNELGLQSTVDIGSESNDLFGSIFREQGITHQQFADNENNSSSATDSSPMEVDSSGSGQTNTTNKRGRRSLKALGLSDEEIIQRRRLQNALSQKRRRLKKKNENRTIDDSINDSTAQTTTLSPPIDTSQEVDINSSLFALRVHPQPIQVISSGSHSSNAQTINLDALNLPLGDTQIKNIFIINAQKPVVIKTIDLRLLKTMVDS